MAATPGSDRAALYDGHERRRSTQPGYVASIQFVNGWMPPAAIAALGGPGAGKLPPGNGVIRVTNVAVNASLVNLGWTGPEGLFQVQAAANLGHLDRRRSPTPTAIGHFLSPHPVRLTSIE